MKSKVLIVLFFVSMMTSCGIEDALDCYDGEIVNKELNFTSFQKIDIDFPSEVILQKGNTQKITIIGREDLIKDLESRSTVSNNTWKARIRNNCYFHSRDVKIFITIPGLSEIKIDGNTKVETEPELDNLADQLKCLIDGNASLFLDVTPMKSLSLDVDGNAKVDLKGQTQTLQIDIDGNATILGHDMVVKTCSVSIDGKATANLFVEETLHVNIDGNGTVCYKGNPVITSVISGDGRIINCN